MDKLVLIDGNSLINRAFYATPPLSKSDGTPTNAVYAFINMLVKIIGDIKPTHILVAFDRKEPTFRHKLFPQYKGTRKPMPDSLRPQIDIMKDVLDSMGIARFECAGIEADDIIGSLAKKFTIPTIIITGDKDSFQLVDETTSVYFTRKGISDLDIYSYVNFKEKTGINPIQIIDLKSLMGDVSDNIPGVYGIGEVTALKLVKTYGTLENLYEHLDELREKVKDDIVRSQGIAFLSKTLATINTGVKIPVELKDLTYKFPFSETARQKFADLEFKNLIRKENIFQPIENKPTDKNNNVNAVSNQIQVKKVTSVSDFPIISHDNLISLVIDKDIYLFDGQTEYFFPIRETLLDEGLGYNEALNFIQQFVEDKNCKLIVFKKKDVMTELNKYEVSFNAFADDVMIEKYLVDFSGKDESLFEVIEQYGYAKSEPAYSLYRIHCDLANKLKDENMESLYKDVELPLCDVLFEMERNGFKIDIKALDEMAIVYEKELENLLGKIKEYAGKNVNPNSPKQIGEILFDKLKLDSKKKTKSGYSTNAEVLEKLVDEHPIVPLILRYRQIQKLYSTYIKGFKPLINISTGLVHTCFNQTVTSTGRLSSKEPNLQNIPVRDQEGKEIRKLFISSFENGSISGADYSQIELRLLAHFSGCQPLIDAFNSDKDIHALTASQVFGVELNDVTPEMRSSAKAVNFGIIYGISDFGLSEQLKISPKRAKNYIDKYFETYTSVKEYMEGNVKFARENGYVKTLLGRKRYINEINSPNHNIRTFGERAAMNMPLQGTAADIIKIAMINVSKRMKKENVKSKLILQVHDELLIDTYPGEEDIIKEILLQEMQSAVTLAVPLKAEAESGKRWFDAK